MESHRPTYRNIERCHNLYRQGLQRGCCRCYDVYRRKSDHTAWFVRLSHRHLKHCQPKCGICGWRDGVWRCRCEDFQLFNVGHCTDRAVGPDRRQRQQPWGRKHAARRSIRYDVMETGQLSELGHRCGFSQACEISVMNIYEDSLWSVSGGLHMYLLDTQS